MHPADIQRETRDFLVSTFLIGSSEQLSDNDPLLGKVIDSTGVLELIGFLERQFSITIPDEDICIRENLNSYRTLLLTSRKSDPALASHILMGQIVSRDSSTLCYLNSSGVTIIPHSIFIVDFVVFCASCDGRFTPEWEGTSGAHLGRSLSRLG